MMADEDIAIVGVGCRFPGADNIDEFWRVLLNGEDHVKEIPITRWKNEAFYDKDQSVPGKTYVRNAGLLNNHDRWDNRLFGISDEEARRIDPQHRYVLECVHMALEDGGITRKRIYGSNTGVIIGCMNNDYKAISISSKSDINRYTTTSTSASLISARVASVYNLQGTCFTLDTACSSALVAIHLASQAIQTGDCDMMICGGVSSILTPDTFVALCKARMLSPTGKCQSFSETADGYARGEGCGIVIVKTLKSALEDGNKIWATIQTGSNQDGATTRPMTAPSAEQQIQLLRRVYEKHQFDPVDIQYIEAHGTGTPRGDPTELNSLGEFFHSFRQTTAPPLVGSVKSNIGHTESAAGVAGLIKVLLMMKYGKYVPSLHVKDNKSNVNKRIKLTEYGLDIVTTVRDWELNHSGARHACINSFGFGGSNTHAIITHIKRATTLDGIMPKCRTMCFCISGLDQRSLELNLTQFQNDINHFDNSLHDIATTSLLYRDIYPFRTLLHGNQISDLQQECRKRIDNVKRITPHESHNIVFVYCGEGTTWKGMGQTLMQENDVFIQKINEIDEHLEPLTGWKIGPKLASDSIYDDPELNIIAIFSIQVALTEVWRSLGVKPDKIIGQSIGEIAASYAANLLLLEEAITIAYHIAKILSNEPEGSMVVIGNINIHDIEILCEENKLAAKIAVYNSPNCCTLSGNEDIIQMIADDLKQNRKDTSEPFVRKLNVKRGYHSKLLKTPVHEITDVIDRSLAEICTYDTRMMVQEHDMISTITNELLTPSEIKNGLYWARNILHPVLFMQSIKAAFDESCYNIFLELGPRPVLKPHLPHIFEDCSRARVLASISVNNENSCFHSSVRELFELGFSIHIDKLAVVPIQGEVMRIPRYTFNSIGDLFTPNLFEDYLSGSFETDDRSHMFVENVNEKDFRLCIDSVSTPFVFDHFLSNKVIVPGATYVEAGFHIGTMCLRKPAYQLSVSFSFIKTCSPSTEQQIKLIVQFDKRESNFIEFSIIHDTKVLATGSVSRKCPIETNKFDIENLQSLCSVYKSKTDCYSCLADLNFKYGKRLSLIEEAWVSVSGEKCLTKMHFAEELLTVGTEKTHIHPAVIDAVFQIFGILEKESISKKHFVIPKGVRSVLLHRHIEKDMFAYAEKVAETNTSAHYNAVLMNREGQVIAEIIDFYTNIISSDDPFGEKSLLYEINWVETDSYTVKDPARLGNLLLVSSHPDSIWLKEFCTTIRTKAIKNIKDLHLRKYLSDENAALVYHVGTSTGKVTKPTTSEVHENAVKRFMDLKNLISSLNISKSEHIFTIITENTQICPERKTINIIGLEVWGMIRSAFHEGVLKNVKLIDIDPENIDIDVLSKTMFSRNDNDIEYVIAGTKVFRPRLVATRRKKTLYRNSKADESKDLAICLTELSNKEDRTYLSAAKIEKTVLDSMRIRLQSFTVHDKALYPLTSSPSMNLHKLDCQMGDQMLVLEGVGSSESGQIFQFLFPVHARTYVHVPNEFLIKSAICKTYVSGMLILLHTLVQLTSKIDEYSEIAIIRNTAVYDTGQQILESLVKEKCCTTSFFTIKELRRCEKMVQANKLIITQRLTFKHLLSCLRHFRDVEEIISFKSLVPKDLSALMSQVFPNTKLKLLNITESFHLDEIRQTMPVIKKYLNKLKTKGSAIRNTFVLPLPMKTLDIREQMINKELSLYCDESTLFRPDSCYIVTGGASGLGWELLQLMVEKGAGMVVNFSRRKPSDTVQEHMDSLAQRFSCRIISLKVDVSDMDSVVFGFNEIQKYFPNFSIKGIFHGAAVTSDSILEQIEEGNICKVMRPKVLGAVNLHQASMKFSLDYFVLHSSIVSVIGNPGQCNYAAANSFLDTFAYYRRSKGLPAQSVNWGPLSVGLAVETDDMKSVLEKKGFKSIGTETIKDIFIEVLMNDSTNSIYSEINWGKMLSIPTFQKQTIKFANFLNQETVQIRKNHRENIDVDTFQCLDENEQKGRVKAILKGIICSVMVIEKDRFNDDMSLTEIGLDSMASMSLSNCIQDAFGCRIPVVTLLSDSSSLSSIAEVVRTKFTCKDTAYSDSRTDSPDSGYSALIDNTDTSHIFLSDTISFMQKDLLSSSKVQRNNPYDLRVIDMEMKDVQCTTDEWKEILSLVIKVHPELRKRFISSENNGLSGEILQESDASLEIIEVDETDFRNPKGKDVRNSLSLNIFESLPLSFRIAHTTHGTLIRMILHAVVFDMRSLSMICKTIAWAGSVVVKKSNEAYEHTAINVTAAIRKAIMPRMRDLGLYWKRYLNADVYSVTLGKTLNEVNAAFCCIQSTNIPAEKVSAIKVYVSKIGISIYEFFMTLYQLFLFIGSRSNIIAVGTAADMRFHVPELNNVVTRCTNYIPVIAYIDASISFSEFIKRNSIRISDTTKHGAYPSSLILKYIKTDKARANIFRHFMSINDMKYISKLMAGNRHTAEIKKIWHTTPNRETFIYLRYDLQNNWIQLETGYNTEICGVYGEQLPNKLMELVDLALNNDDMTISEVRDELTKVGGDSEQPLKINHLLEYSDFPTTQDTQTIQNEEIVRTTQSEDVVPLETTVGSLSEQGQEKNNEDTNVCRSCYDGKNGQFYKEPFVKTEEHWQILLSGQFLKQTAHGWDHKVNVTLNSSLDGKTASIQWGKERKIRKVYRRILNLSEISNMSLRRTNGITSITIVSKMRNLVLKTSNKVQAEEWFELIESLLQPCDTGI